MNWAELLSKIGITEVNEELDRCTKQVYDGLRHLASVCTSNENLTARLKSQYGEWSPVRDQYLRSVLHLAAFQGNTRLVKCLVFACAEVNLTDGIGQTPLTLALHLGHNATAYFLIANGATLQKEYFPDTVCPRDIAVSKENTQMVEAIDAKLSEDEHIYEQISVCFEEQAPIVNPDNPMEVDAASAQGDKKFSRVLNINVGDQKNTVTIQGCANSCPDVYSCHTPGAGDFHNRGYLNESVARLAGQGGFWHVVEHVMKRPTINPNSFKSKFKDNNYNNNEEALYDYEDGLTIAMMIEFKASKYFPSNKQLRHCLLLTGSHNEILLEKWEEWLHSIKENPQANYQAEFANELIPISRWYRESVRNGNGEAIEGVWMLCPALYAQVGKTNYRDESLTHLTNVLGKWPLAYRYMYQRNRTVNLDGKQGRQLAGDEWVEGHLVCPVKTYARAQSSFSVLEMMSCSSNLLEINRSVYKSKEAFDIHRTKKHCKPSSLYDQLKVAQFALRHKWFSCKATPIYKYPWGDKTFKDGETVAEKYLDATAKGRSKIKDEFNSFLHRKFPNEVN